MTRRRLCYKSQKFRLLEEVGQLCESLGRPVSSKDLAAFWQREPDRRPLLLQRVGQLLIKASRVWKSPVPRLHRIGVLGNLGFYALDDSRKWHDALRLHKTRLALRRQCRMMMPFHAVYLIDTEHDGLARNAMRGFLLEFAEAAEDDAFRDWLERTRWPDMVRLAQTYAAGSFTGVPPTDFISRGKAAAMLRREYGRRYPFGVAPHLSVGRHLVRLAWPQSGLFKQGGYSRAQVEAYCSARWPLEEDDPNLSRAVFLCMAYGRGSE